ncbi:peritrophin-44 [Ceratitis capitata]|uniref:(Mediterranean fruit fly) hypothetical protein n=1 Tax=Ceratitis capitata TaxID=7213 RepID=A0A811V229_CERCA|nr:peritrophin-44 [Ceratitis capitata]XP_020716613.1 peritrophin-44 [Ceratitis capitata]CAD7005110.1 unnamed protein product [Ceratitis capitata]
MASETAKILLALFGLLIVCADSVTAVYNMTQTCAYYPEGYIANPSDCQAWGYCKGGLLIAEGKCGTGMLYDSEKGICNYASQVQCKTSLVDICKNLQDAGHIADPNDCSSYCYCSNQTLVGCASCPTNQLYNPTLGQCNYDYQCPTDSVCRLVKNNAFVGAPTCGKYIRCLDGTGDEASCANNYYFNRLTGYCEKTNSCDSSSPASSTQTTLAPDASICSTSYTVTSGEQYISDGKTCFGYYSCSSKSGSGSWRACPYTMEFDSTTSTCVQANQNVCLLNRCENINLQFVTAPNTECKSYYICNGSQQSATATACKSPYSYFDEVIQKCTDVAPSYPICKS